MLSEKDFLLLGETRRLCLHNAAVHCAKDVFRTQHREDDFMGSARNRPVVAACTTLAVKLLTGSR
jgi:hypothetical protein